MAHATRRILMCILLLFPVLGAGTALCQDFFMGKVLAVDPEKMEITIAPLSTGRVSETDLSHEPVQVRIAEDNNLPMGDETVFLPRCVVVGEKIRLWGRRGKHGEHLFFATDIRGCRGGGCSDPTGVRFRLLQGRKHKMRHRNSDDTGRRNAGVHGPGHGDLSGKDHDLQQGNSDRGEGN